MIALLLAMAAVAAPPSDAFQARVTGQYACKQGPEEAERILDAQVDQAIRGLPWAWRPFARKPLRRAATRCARWRLALDHETFAIDCLDEPGSFSRRLDNSEPDWRDEEEGETYEVTVEVDEPRVSIRWTGPRGGQLSRYTFPEGGGMVLHNQVFSRHLSEPLEWSFTYREVDGGGAGAPPGVGSGR